MRMLPVVALGTAIALALGGAAYAATREDEEPPLPPPEEDGPCSTSADVGQATSSVLADNTVDAAGLRNAANVLRNWTTYCDDAARETGKASIQLLEAKATLLDNPPPVPSNEEPAQAGSLWPVPPGYEGSHHTTGLHNEPGTVYWYPNKDMWFFPDNSLLIPYYIPGGSWEIKTQGGLAHEDDCERCGS